MSTFLHTGHIRHAKKFALDLQPAIMQVLTNLLSKCQILPTPKHPIDLLQEITFGHSPRLPEQALKVSLNWHSLLVAYVPQVALSTVIYQEYTETHPV